MKTITRMCLEDLSKNGSDVTADQAKEILHSPTSFIQARDGFYGGFMQSLVQGNIFEAINKADLTNLRSVSETIVVYLTSVGGLGNAK